ncbi:hypothetical protein EDC01DRAFT_666066 [Geopyxis carbonaria]|nr:hypothetical protein EDC01DRAFT_666066 [Geopyxis carbonaria]
MPVLPGLVVLTPSSSQGGHWADPDFFTTIKTNVTENQFWELDIGTRKWTEISPKGGDDILGTEAGAYATAPSLGLGFQVGGRVNQFTDSRFSELGLANNDTMLLASMLIYDFSDNSMRNVSTTEGIRSPWGTGPGPSYPYGGGLVWVPVGPKGHLVFFGGFEYDEPVMRETSLMTNGRAMTVINIYEIATDTWYSQTASGYIPTDRGHFCTSLVAAPDNSSYNIFMHGGTSDEEAFAETYVLSLPAFEWILVSKGNDTQPRSHMNCWTTPQHKLVSLGGHGIDQELPTAAPFKNGRCDPQPLLNVFDTQTLAWEDTIGPVTEDRPAWRVPEKIWEVVGGDETGGAWLREPEAGWSDGKLKALYDDNMPAAPPVGERKTGGVKVASAAVASGPGASTLAVVVAAMLAAIL